MVEIAEIEDRESFEAWLTETNQPREVCIAMAFRAAMRVLPVVWASQIERGRSPISFLRANLVAGVVGLAPHRLLTEPGQASALRAASNAARAARATRADARAAADAAAYAANAAEARAAAAAAAARASYAASYAAARAADAVWSAIRSDCERLAQGQSPTGTPLFPDANPAWFASRYRTIHVATGSPEWWFWHDWFERAVEGHHWHWPTLIEIALQEGDFWRGSDEEVNARIRELVDQHGDLEPDASGDAFEAAPAIDADTLEKTKQNSPNAEEVYLNSVQAFDVRPVTVIPDSPFATAKQRAHHLAADMREKAEGPGGNAYGVFSEIAADLEKELLRSADWPMLVYDMFIKAVAEINLLVETGDLPANDRHVVSPELVTSPLQRQRISCC